MVSRYGSDVGIRQIVNNHVTIFSIKKFYCGNRWIAVNSSSNILGVLNIIFI